MSAVAALIGRGSNTPREAEEKGGLHPREREREKMKMKAKKPTKKTCQSVLEACSRTTETSRRRKSTFGPLLLDIFGQSSV